MTSPPFPTEADKGGRNNDFRHLHPWIYLLQRGEEVQRLLEPVAFLFDFFQQDVRMVAQFVALLANQVEGVMVAGRHLVSVKNHHMSFCC